MMFVLRRALLMIPTLLGITIITFVAVRVVARDPVLAQMEAGQKIGANTEQVIQEYRHRKGLDLPIPVQYARWLGRAVSGDFGISVKDNRPIGEKLTERVPITLLLSGLSVLLIYLIAIPIGVFSAVKRDTTIDRVSTTFLFMLYSLPDFWVATILVYYLCGGDYFDWFPAVGLSTEGADKWALGAWFSDRLWHLVLPVFCLTYAGLASISRYQRTALIEVISQDFVRTARAKGLPEKLVIFKHALRNALIPIATIAGTLLPTLFGGSVIVERIFNIPGMGLLSFEAVLNGDTDMIMATTLIAASAVMIGLLLTDVAYMLIDPRIALDRGSA